MENGPAAAQAVGLPRPRVGYLASGRNGNALVEWLDAFEQPPVVNAERVSDDDHAVLLRAALGRSHVVVRPRRGDARRVGRRHVSTDALKKPPKGNQAVKVRQFIGIALVLALISPIAQADLSAVKQDIKRDSKEAAHKTGEAARSFGHATASAAKAVGHGVAHASREGWDATKRTTKRIFHKRDPGASSGKSGKSD